MKCVSLSIYAILVLLSACGGQQQTRSRLTAVPTGSLCGEASCKATYKVYYDNGWVTVIAAGSHPIAGYKVTHYWEDSADQLCPPILHVFHVPPIGDTPDVETPFSVCMKKKCDQVYPVAIVNAEYPYSTRPYVIPKSKFETGPPPQCIESPIQEVRRD